MKKYWQVLSLVIITSFLIVIISPLVSSQRPLVSSQRQISWSSNVEDTMPIVQEQAVHKNNKQDIPVILDGETLFNFSPKIKGTQAKDRAARASLRIETVAKDSDIPLDSLQIVEFEGLKLINAEDRFLFAISKSDAKLANSNLDELAESYIQKVKKAIAQYREKHSLKKLITRIVSAITEFIIFIVLLKLSRKLLNWIYLKLDHWRTSLLRPIRIQGLELLSVEQETNLLLGWFKLLYLVTVAVIVFVYLSLLTRYFPQTTKIGQLIFDSLSAVLDKTFQAVIAYLPNLFSIILTIVIAYYIFRFCQLFFHAIETGNLSLPGFDQDWARPTEKLLIFLIFAFTIAIIFPLLPGAQSPAFRGLSIFVGALFTLGGASAIANIVGGVVIIYTRAFRVGDRVQIADVQGDILEKSILSTRIRTSKNKIVTIPNANLITSNIENFTTSSRDINEPVILHTVITLGYDVPWRHVYQVLIEAALSSPSILEKPAPFVLQTSLGDFSVSYELNAYTDQPSMMSKIYSQLHENIQDKCNEAGIEILSPQYSALRDGHQNTIPEDYLPKDYAAPGFRLDPINKLLNKPDN